MTRPRRLPLATFPARLLAGLYLFAVWPWLPLGAAGQPPATIVFYGFSILDEAFHKGIFPAFEEDWHSETGQEIELISSFTGSGTVTNQLKLGVPADLAFGDALVTCEQEALANQAKGKLTSEVVYPRRTILSEHVLVVVDRQVSADERLIVDAFVAYLWGEQAQRIFVEKGFRSVDEALNEANPAFGEIAEPFTVADLGGWAAAKREIVDGLWKEQVLPELGT